MSEKTKIEWCDHTHNPWRGCAKVSPGCQHCYAEGWGKRFGVEWGPGKPRARASDAYLAEPRRWNAAAGRAGVRRRVFCGSLMDWLDPEVPVEWLADLLDTIRQTPNLDWLLLTKRPGNWRTRIMAAHNEMITGSPESVFVALWLGSRQMMFDPAPPANVWLGVSAEDQERWDERVPVLLSIPARIRFVSVEPLLGPVTFWPHIEKCAELASVDWIILGGESGPKARPCNIEWIRSGVQQCREAGVACFVKQLGTDSFWTDEYNGMSYTLHPIDRKGGDPASWPEDLRVRRFP